MVAVKMGKLNPSVPRMAIMPNTSSRSGRART